MKDAPLFSIVINNYNYGAYINSAIDSALAQSYQPTEVVVVDDGSTDDSRNRIESYGDQITAVYQENAGQTEAMNSGFANSRGEFVIFLDADDCLGPEVASQASSIFVANMATVLVHWRMHIINGEGNRIGQTMPKLDPDEGNLLDTILTLGPNSYRRPPTSGAAWRRSYLGKVTPFPANERKLGLSSAALDAYLSTIAPLYGRVARLTDPSGAYRVHGKNSYATSSFDSKISRLLKLYKAHGLGLEQHCKSLGLSYSKTQWGSRSWPHQIDRSLREMRDTIDLAEPFVLIDEMQWGMDATPERKMLPFLERDGVYWGMPSNDDEAIEELDRMRNEGVKAVVLAWPAYWWLDHYARFSRHLRTTANCLIENDRIIVFDLTAEPTPDLSDGT